MPARNNKLEQLNIRLPRTAKLRLTQLAMSEEISVARYATRILEDHVEDELKQKGREVVLEELRLDFEEQVGLYSSWFDDLEA